MARLLVINGLTKYFKSPRIQIRVFDGITFSVDKGEFVCLLGPSGCGKTTLLRILAGLENQSGGSILIHGREVKGPGYERAIVFQEPRLFPWLTVEDNIAFGLKGRVPTYQHEDIVHECLELIGLEEFAKVFPHELSGGMAQRVSIARALAINPEILLLDEPLSALDALTRIRLQEELIKLWSKTGKTMIMVTHDLEEALQLGQRVLIMSSAPGRIIHELVVRSEDIQSGEFLAEEFKPRDLKKLSDIKKEIMGYLGFQGKET